MSKPCWAAIVTILVACGAVRAEVPGAPDAGSTPRLQPLLPSAPVQLPAIMPTVGAPSPAPGLRQGSPSAANAQFAPMVAPLVAPQSVGALPVANPLAPLRVPSTAEIRTNSVFPAAAPQQRFVAAMQPAVMPAYFHTQTPVGAILPTAGASLVAQQPSVTYVPAPAAAPQTNSDAGAAVGAGLDGNAAAVESAPLIMKRYDHWYDPTCGGGANCSSCAPGGCNKCPCYLRGEYLMWWLSGDPLPPLVTTSPSGTPPAEAGVLGQPNTSVLFGDSGANTSGRSGARITLGMWLNSSARFEAEWFVLGGSQTSFNQSSAGDPILAAPFFNLATSAADAYLLAYPGTSEGSISIRDVSFFNGAGAHVMRDFHAYRTANGGFNRFGGLYGFRYLGLYEKLTIASTTTAGGGAGTFDAFRTTNNFIGGNFGLYAEHYGRRWTLGTIGRLGFGSTVEHATISGDSCPNSVSYPAGLYAYPSSIGSYGHQAFSVVPQLELKIGYNLSPRWRLVGGYDLIYWSRVARPGQQINTALNPSELSGGTTQQFTLNDGNLLIQGFNGGVELRY